MEEENVPNKYKKHKALVLLGLKTQEELDEDLTRFDAKDFEKIKTTILGRIKSARIPRAYLLSLIPKDGYHSLPNCIVSNEEDFTLLEILLARHQEAVEVWAFPKELQASIGRFAIRDNSVDISSSQILEQVWSTNHRDIEHYDSNSKVPLISASRMGWRQRYTFDKAQNIPRDDMEIYVQEFANAATEIERKRDKIEEIAEYFKSLGVDSFSLEYRLDSKGFSFIDWDTSHDDRVLADLFPSKKKNKYEKRIEDDAR